MIPLPNERPGEPSFGDLVVEFLPWVAAPVVLGPITLLVASIAVAGLIRVAGAILASPYLLLRHWRQHLAERRRSSKRPPAFTRAIAQTTAGGRQ